MIEQIVSFEAAKLAQEKGFNIRSEPYRYNKDGELTLLEGINAPRQSLLQKWLREKHKIHVEPTLNFTIDEMPLHYNCSVMYGIDQLKNFKWLGAECSYTYYATYEEALEAGVIEALELI